MSELSVDSTDSVSPFILQVPGFLAGSSLLYTLASCPTAPIRWMVAFWRRARLAQRTPRRLPGAGAAPLPGGRGGQPGGEAGPWAGAGPPCLDRQTDI